MEKITDIKQDEFQKGYFIELQCSMCLKEVGFGADTKDELKKIVFDADWKNLESDEFQCIGWWCGCDYMP